MARSSLAGHCSSTDSQKCCQLQESPQDWSDQETLLLLEGMEMYGENWAEIAEHVGTRSQVHFQNSLPGNLVETGHLYHMDVPYCLPWMPVNSVCLGILS